MSTKYKRLYHRDFPPHLPENVVVEILLRLPVKSLVRFRCVSKRWRSLISDPRFAKSQFMRTSERSQRLLISSSSEIRSLDCEEPFEDSSTPSVLAVPFQKRGRYVSIIGSSNGLVYVALYSHRDFYIWNPSTGNYRKLPDPGITLRTRKYRHGFGYDPSTDDYKLLVANFRMHPFRESEAKVFSFKRNSWKRILRGLDDTGLAEDSVGILCNASLHWHLHACREPLTGQKIGGFDLAEEKFHEMPMPFSDWGPHGYVSIDTLSTLGERLCFIVSMDTHMEIRGMMEYGVIESWALLSLA
ncbi:F-box/kelch-repeat protein At3g06240-like [Carya illinoinensis]|uniref:F-box/kelch-repeat protein At3g06240-like n=1 Tax=Carya illinoinensis TaxID=32201 RepID=UPI001C727E41|nr:F-box/kelch-repeat protein At3g06240-like [Carya illinoinensis]